MFLFLLSFSLHSRLCLISVHDQIESDNLSLMGIYHYWSFSNLKFIQFSLGCISDAVQFLRFIKVVIKFFERSLLLNNFCIWNFDKPASRSSEKLRKNLLSSQFRGCCCKNIKKRGKFWVGTDIFIHNYTRTTAVEKSVHVSPYWPPVSHTA